MTTQTLTPEIFENRIFQDEAISPRQPKSSGKLPAVLARARGLEQNDYWQSSKSVFYRQGQMLAQYEDDYPYNGEPYRYYPTYQSLTDKELRGYFSWRTKIRKGIYEPVSPTFIFLHIYELINNIGVDTPEEGYEKLLELKRRYGPEESRVDTYLQQWLDDYVIYYNLDASLLDTAGHITFSSCLRTLEHLEEESEEKVIAAITQLAPKWLGRSRFYADNYENMNTVIYRVLKNMSAHYAKKCKRTLVEQLFGRQYTRHYHIFSQAIFCNPLKRLNYRYEIHDQFTYECKCGIWTTSCRIASPYSGRKLDKLLKTIDSVMREECASKYPIKPESGVKWILDLIRGETRALLAENAAREKKRVQIDLGQLGRIRKDAELTREKLIVEEEEIGEEAPVEAPEPGHHHSALEPCEQRLLKCLLYGRDLAWVRQEGYLLSVLADSINEKLYDIFNDTVLEDGPEIVPDYIPGLKEMIPA